MAQRGADLARAGAGRTRRAAGATGRAGAGAGLVAGGLRGRRGGPTGAAAQAGAVAAAAGLWAARRSARAVVRTARAAVRRIVPGGRWLRRLLVVVLVLVVLAIFVSAATFQSVAGNAQRARAAALAQVTAVGVAWGTSQDDAQGCGDPAGDDGTPTIVGDSALSAGQIQQWWSDTGQGQPDNLNTSIDDLIEAYLDEGEAEGVRGDVALAQAIHETGWFTNGDTAINNYAGIGHPDSASQGMAFDDARTGVRAHIQLLKKYARGNDVELANRDVAPDAGAQATTFGELAGTWATDPDYWSGVEGRYLDMAAGDAGGEDDDSQSSSSGGDGDGDGCGSGSVGEYALPIDVAIYERDGRRLLENGEPDDSQGGDWFAKPHHDYAAADIPVPDGTEIRAVASGTVVDITREPDVCGNGIVIEDDSGARYSYCHASRLLVSEDDVADEVEVDAGDTIMLSGNTGNSTGPHLHLGIRVPEELPSETNWVSRCPQPFLLGIYDGDPVAPTDLPTHGCYYATSGNQPA